MYTEIIDPLSNKALDINTINGKQLVQKYIFQYNSQLVESVMSGGGPRSKSVDNHRSLLKTFKKTYASAKILNIPLMKKVYKELDDYVKSLSTSEHTTLSAEVEAIDSFSTHNRYDGSILSIKLAGLTTIVKKLLHSPKPTNDKSKRLNPFRPSKRFKKVKPVKKNGKLSCLGDYKVVKKLGNGAFGNVYLVKKKGDGKKLYAMKAQIVGAPVGNSLENIGREIQIGTMIGKKHLGPMIFDSFICKTGDLTTVFIVMQHMNMGTVAEFSQKHLVPDEFIKLLRQKIAKMHNMHIVHGDLHMGNVLVNEENGIFVPYLADFGLSKSFIEAGFERSSWESDPEWIGDLVWNNHTQLILRIIILSGLF
tara:strand:+ start:659 stop:1753 length:1095 start_codon:yes stop_codon:yes gene_type:complete